LEPAVSSVTRIPPVRVCGFLVDTDIGHDT
jgi:hypothetical protein